MKPGARIQAAIELLAAIEVGSAPADRTVDAYFRARRYAGSGDRSAVIELVYAVLRHRAGLDWRAPGEGGEAPDAAARRRVLAALVVLEGTNPAALATLFEDGPHSPGPLTSGELALLAALATPVAGDIPDWVRGNYPEWLDQALRERFGEALPAETAALNARAPVDLRVNRLKAPREDVLDRLAGDGIEAAACPLSPLGVRLAARTRITGHPLFREGAVEVQDEGSQVAALLAGVRPGEQVVDLCAGAGGKTLALAAEMANRGQVYACDRDARRLGRLAPRLVRAGAHNVQRRRLLGLEDPWLATVAGKADRVLIDAPCSGSGAWRRNPDAKWRLTPAALDDHVANQRALLDAGARLVRPGGRLVYVTCSLLAAENEAQVEAVLSRTPEYRPLPASAVWAETLGGTCPAPDPWLVFTPLRNGTDGFFIAVLERADAPEATG
jgi:16S rRNA (cytosine967-C5)-methyltransferase